MHSMPFEFEPLALDFPALTLQCLQPPPTLFSSTQHPTTTSWSISPPDHQQYEALRTYFAEEFRKWRITCETVTTAVNEDLQYPPSSTVFKCEAQEAAHRGLKVAETLERQVDNHLQTTFTIWEGLPAERRNELWVLELARSVGKKQHEMDKLKETQHKLRQVRLTNSLRTASAARKRVCIEKLTQYSGKCEPQIPRRAPQPPATATRV